MTITTIMTYAIPHTVDDSLVLDFMEDVQFAGHKRGSVFSVTYLEFTETEKTSALSERRIYSTSNTQYFAATDFIGALTCFRKRKNRRPFEATEGGSLDDALPKE